MYESKNKFRGKKLDCLNEMYNKIVLLGLEGMKVLLNFLFYNSKENKEKGVPCLLLI